MYIYIYTHASELITNHKLIPNVIQYIQTAPPL